MNGYKLSGFCTAVSSAFQYQTMSSPAEKREVPSGLRRQIPIVCPGHSRPLAEVQYCPNPTANPHASVSEPQDHFLLISACHDKMPMLRCGRSGNWIGTFEGHKGAVWSAKLNFDGTQAITGSADFSVKLWDAVSGDNIRSFEHRHVVKTVEFIKSGAWIATGGHEKFLRVYDIASANDTPLYRMTSDDVIRKIVEIPEQPAVTVVTGDTAGTMVFFIFQYSNVYCRQHCRVEC
jgi:serine-threonine kinase receptor-associated protein